MKKLLQAIPRQLILPLFIFGGVLAGLGSYIIYVSRLHDYASDKSEGCINCHVMSPYYESWQHSSHQPWTNCNDCHVPHNNLASKYAFKAIDGLYHSTVFTFNAEAQVIRPRDASSNVIMANCIRCHTQLNQEFVNTGMLTFAQTKNGEGKACWHCHRNVPHTVRSNISSSPHTIVPMPESPVPTWLKDKIKK